MVWSLHVSSVTDDSRVQRQPDGVEPVNGENGQVRVPLRPSDDDVTSGEHLLPAYE